MKIRNHQAGFTIVEALLILIFLSGVASVGYFLILRNKSVSYESPVASVPSAPIINTVGDLTSADQTLDQTNVDEAAADASQLESQLSAF